jgi:alkanesulfonate monooxygenase SsuD/methylene tetrahydromethanopterin reductase-like flavin-dependent oxidoreductase (luciferase family)
VPATVSTAPKLGLHFQLPSHPAVSPHQRFRDTVEQAVVGEALGFESVWPVEQHFDAEASMLSAPLLLLAAIAERTTRLRLGTAILLASLHHPVRLAAELATLDVLSGGRVECGLGRGMDPVHFARFDQTRPDGYDHLAETIEVLRRAWTDAASDVHPRPLQLPHPPIRVAANSPGTFRHAGRAGLPILVAAHINPPHQLAELLALYRQEREAAGHRHGDDVTVLTPVFAHPDPERLRQLVEPGVERIAEALHRKLSNAEAAAPGGPSGDGQRAMIASIRGRLGDLRPDTMAERRMAIFASPARAAEQLHALSAELGATRVICWFNPGGLIPHRDVLAAMERLALEAADHGLLGSGTGSDAVARTSRPTCPSPAFAGRVPPPTTHGARR